MKKLDRKRSGAEKFTRATHRIRDKMRYEKSIQCPCCGSELKNKEV